MPGRLRRSDEPGELHFVTMCCYPRLQFFRHESVRQAFIDAMGGVRDRWIGYVIMPEHVHFAVFPAPQEQSAGSISRLLLELKGASGRWCDTRQTGSGVVTASIRVTRMFLSQWN